MRNLPLRFAVLSAFAGLVSLLAVGPIANNDIWLHLKTGSLILERWQVPQVDAYTFTRVGAPYIAHEWLAQVVFAILYRLGGGLKALSLAYAALAGTLLWLIYRETALRIVQDGADRRIWAGAIATLTTVIAFFQIASFLAIRPHIFSFLFVATFTAILPRLELGESKPRSMTLLALLFLQLLWANLHGAFIIGILLAAIHVAASALSRRRVTRMVALPLALAAVSCLNPYGWRIYSLVSRFSDPIFRRVIVEWESPFESRFASTHVFAVYLLWLGGALSAGVWAAKRRRDFAPLMSVLTFGAMSALSRRHICLLVIVTAPLIGRGIAAAAAPFSRRSPGVVIAAGWAALLPVLCLAGLIVNGLLSDSAVPLRPGIVARNIPVESLEVMRAENLHGRVFTTIGLGSYVTWRGWPDLTTSIDSRLEVFGGAFITTHLMAERDPERFKEFLAHQPFDLALLPWRLTSVRGALTALESDQDWALIYFDDVVVLYARRTPEREALIERRAFHAIDPVRFLAQEGFGSSIDLSAARREAERAASDPQVLPGRPPVNTVALRMLRILLPSSSPKPS